MDKKKIQLSITGVLIIVMILAWVSSIKTVKERSKPKATLALAVTKPFIGSSKQLLASKDKKSSTESKLKWYRCPFSGELYGGSDARVALRLSGILWDDVSPKAIINNRIVGIGETVAKHKVIEIKKDRVTLSIGAERIEFKLK